MTRWIRCGRHFVEGDVVRWKEAVWERKAYGEENARKIGSRIVTAQVTGYGSEWVDLKVIECTLKMYDGWLLGNLKPGERLRRRRGPMGTAIAATERLAWSDESARSLVASEHFRPEPTAPEMPKHAAKAEQARRTGGKTRRGYQRKGRRKTRLTP